MEFNALQNYTRKKFLPTLAIQFLLVLSYILLQELKVRGLAETGLYESLGTAHLWGGLPLSIIFVLAYFKVVNTFERRHHLTLFLVPFSAFFLLYAHVFFPNHESFHISQAELALLLEKYPGFPGIIHMYANWSTSLFMMLVDIWSNFVVGVLFWQFMNDTTSVKQARISYPLLGLSLSIFTSLSLAINGIIDRYTIAYDAYLPYALTIIASLWVGIMMIQNHLNTNVILKDKTPKSVSCDKLKLSILETFGHVFTSRYLGYLATMVLSFGIMINLLDRVILYYKGLLMQAHLSDLDLPKISLIVAFITFCVSIFMALLSMRLLEKKNGWFKAAIMTPIIIASVSLVLLFSSMVEHTSASAGYLFIMVSFAVLLIKQVKPFFFKPVKEMAYIPLEAELKVKGKATIDLVVERFAVAIGTPIFSIITLISLHMGPKTSLIIPTVFVTLALCALYFFCVKKIAPKFEELTQENG